MLPSNEAYILRMGKEKWKAFKTHMFRGYYSIPILTHDNTLYMRQLNPLFVQWQESYPCQECQRRLSKEGPGLVGQHVKAVLSFHLTQICKAEIHIKTWNKEEKGLQ